MNGLVVRELGTKVSGTDIIEVDGAIIDRDIHKKYLINLEELFQV